jgi:hypothetical protein
MNRYTKQWNPFAGYGAATWTDYAPPAAWAGRGIGQASTGVVTGAWIWAGMSVLALVLLCRRRKD